MAEKTFRLFDHTADLGVEIFGATERELFTHAAMALAALSTETELVSAAEQRHFSVEGTDRADLLVNFLREVLYLINGEKFLLCKVSIDELQPCYLQATVCGERFDASRHLFLKEIKAVTYHQAAVEQTAKGWKGRVILDV